MQVEKILYPITSLGIGRRAGIWMVGCNRNCPGCSNPELHFSNKRYETSIKDIIKSLEPLSFDGITITGGEPFQQIRELRLLVEELDRHSVDDILIFTGYTLEQLKKKRNEDVNFILEHISVLVDGLYDASKPSDKILIGSTNQRVIILKDKYKKDYEKYMKKEKEFNVFKVDGETHVIGVPCQNYKKVYRNLLKGE